MGARDGWILSQSWRACPKASDMEGFGGNLASRENLRIVSQIPHGKALPGKGGADGPQRMLFGGSLTSSSVGRRSPEVLSFMSMTGKKQWPLSSNLRGSPAASGCIRRAPGRFLPCAGRTGHSCVPRWCDPGSHCATLPHRNISRYLCGHRLLPASSAGARSLPRRTRATGTGSASTH